MRHKSYNMSPLFALIMLMSTLISPSVAQLRSTHLPSLNEETFPTFLHRHYLSVVLHVATAAADTLRAKFENACNELRKGEEIEDRRVQFAMMEGEVPKVSGEPYSGEELIQLPNVAVYQGGRRAAWLLDPVACIGDPPKQLLNSSQVVEFVIQRLMPFVNPTKKDPLEEYHPDVVVTGYILEPDGIRRVQPMEDIYLEAFHGVMIHSWYQGSHGAKYSFVLREAEVEDNERRPKVTMRIRNSTTTFLGPKGDQHINGNVIKPSPGSTAPAPFVDFGTSNLYFSLLQWVQNNALPDVLPIIRCTYRKMLELPGIVLIAINLPLDEVVDDARNTGALTDGWRIFYTNVYTPEEIFMRYGIDAAAVRAGTYRGVAIEKVEEDTGLYGRRVASSKYKLECTHARQAIELYNYKELDRFFISEPIPDAVGDDEDVHQVVGLTMNQFVFDQRHDVVMLFCAPWCGHCKKFEKQFNALARQMREWRPWVRFGRMDATQNDNRFFEFSTSPQIFFFPRKGKEPMDFNLRRDGFEGFNKWVLGLTEKEVDGNSNEL